MEAPRYTHLELQPHRHQQHPGAAAGVLPVLQGQLGMPGLSKFPKRTMGYYGIAAAKGADALINLDTIKHEKFVLVVEHCFIASTYPPASSDWYRKGKGQVAIENDPPVDERLIGPVDKSSPCALHGRTLVRTPFRSCNIPGPWRDQ